MGEFMFPPSKMAAQRTRFEQASLIHEESDEVVEAAAEADSWQILCETYDVINACEGMLRTFPKELRQRAHDYVRASCKARGDYE